MPIITTIAATLAAKYTLESLADTVFTGWLGNRSDHVLTNIPSFTKRVLSKFRDTEQPVNHDLQKAIASSHWLATKVFAEKIQKKAQIKDAFAKVLHVCDQQLELIKKDKYSFAKLSPDAYDADIMILKEKESDPKAILKGKVIEYHIDTLTELCGSATTLLGFKDLCDAIQNGLPDENLDWFDLVCAFLNELLKGDNNKAKDAFQNQELAKIGLAISELEELKETFKTIIDSFVINIGEERFEELKTLVRDELQVIQRDLATIKEITTETLEVVKEIKRIVAPTPITFAQKLTPIPELGTFIGRDKDLNELINTLTTANQVVLMNGMGGIGKTTLARAYVNRNLSAFNYIAWISVTGDNIQEAFTNATYFEETLKTAQSSDGDTDARFTAIIETINNLQGKGLLIIDNAEKDVEDIKHFLPPPPQWQILLTSRLELKAFDTIVKLDKLSEINAEIVFKKYYGKPIKEQDHPIFQSLLREIDYHTLTIELIAKTMRESDNNLKFAEVLEKLQQRQLNHPRMSEVINVNHLNDKQAVLYNHLMTSFNLAQLSEYEIWVLKQFTALQPEPILKDTLVVWLKLDDNKASELEQALKKLRSKGWLKRTENAEGNMQYIIHRLIQDVVHYQYGISFEDIETLIDTFVELLKFDSTTNFTLKFPYLLIAEYILNSLPKELENSQIAFLNVGLGIVYLEFADLNKAEKHLSKAYEIYLAQNNEENIAMCQSNLASVLRNLGNYAQAKDLLESSLEYNIKSAGQNHPKVAINRSSLGIVNKHLGNYKEAKELLELALASDIQNFGQNHPTVAIRQSNLAQVYQALGNYQKAKELFKLALASDIQNFEHTHPSVATNQSNLAQVYQSLGNYQKAKELSESALASDIKNFGYNHPKVANRQTNLAVALISLGNLQEAKQLLESAYNIFQTRLGEGHLHTKTCLNWLNHINKQLD